MLETAASIFYLSILLLLFCILFIFLIFPISRKVILHTERRMDNTTYVVKKYKCFFVLGIQTISYMEFQYFIPCYSLTLLPQKDSSLPQGLSFRNCSCMGLTISSSPRPPARCRLLSMGCIMIEVQVSTYSYLK